MKYLECFYCSLRVLRLCTLESLKLMRKLASERLQRTSLYLLALVCFRFFLILKVLIRVDLFRLLFLCFDFRLLVFRIRYDSWWLRINNCNSLSPSVYSKLSLLKSLILLKEVELDLALLLRLL